MLNRSEYPLILNQRGRSPSWLCKQLSAKGIQTLDLEKVGYPGFEFILATHLYHIADYLLRTDDG